MCARALLVFLLACACSLFLNSGRSSENSSRRVLIVLVLSCRGNGYELEARATPVDDIRPELRAGWALVSGLRPHRLSPLRGLVYVNGRICYVHRESHVP